MYVGGAALQQAKQTHRHEPRGQKRSECRHADILLEGYYVARARRDVIPVLWTHRAWHLARHFARGKKRNFGSRAKKSSDSEQHSAN